MIQALEPKCEFCHIESCTYLVVTKGICFWVFLNYAQLFRKRTECTCKKQFPKKLVLEKNTASSRVDNLFQKRFCLVYQIFLRYCESSMRDINLLLSAKARFFKFLSIDVQRVRFLKVACCILQLQKCQFTRVKRCAIRAFYEKIIFVALKYCVTITPCHELRL